MNNMRRERLNNAISMLENARNIIEEVANEESDSFFNLTEGLQQTERGQRMEEVSGQLQEVADGFDDIISEIEDAMY